MLKDYELKFHKDKIKKIEEAIREVRPNIADMLSESVDAIVNHYLPDKQSFVEVVDKVFEQCSSERDLYYSFTVAERNLFFENLFNELFKNSNETSKSEASANG